MCLILDASAFSAFFRSSNSRSAEFLPIRKWFEKERCGKLVFGGTKYRDELLKANLLPLMSEMERRGKTVHIPTETVDAREGELRKECPDKDFDDPHIVAIADISGCRLVCTEERRMAKYLLNKKLYRFSTKVPKIYNGHRSHVRLLCDKNIATVCK